MLIRTVQDNLHREARAVEDLDFLVCQRVLSPVQAAVFVAEAYPARPDALVLASTCASLGGEPQHCGPCRGSTTAASGVAGSSCSEPVSQGCPDLPCLPAKW